MDSHPELPRFSPARTPGPAVDKTIPWSPLSLFQQFFSASVIKKLLTTQMQMQRKKKRTGQKFRWDILTSKEFYIFLAIIIFTGLVKVHHRRDYWCTMWPYSFQFPKSKMTRDCFEGIMWSLHLSDPAEDEENEKKKTTAGYDRLFKVKPLYTEMVDACMSLFRPYRHINRRKDGCFQSTDILETIHERQTNEMGLQTFRVSGFLHRVHLELFYLSWERAIYNRTWAQLLYSDGTPPFCSTWQWLHPIYGQFLHKPSSLL